MPQQKRALVEPLAPEPAGDFVVAFAGIARTAGGRDVVQGVSPTPGERLHAVPLQRYICRSTVGAATPCRLERCPLLDTEVVLDTIHPAFASTGVFGFPTTRDRHVLRLVPVGQLEREAKNSFALGENRISKMIRLMTAEPMPAPLTPNWLSIAIIR